MMTAKRMLDLSCAVLGLAVTWPLFLFLAVAVRVDSPGPVFFRQERVGFGGARFRIWKFRTMVADAERHGSQLTVGQDARITRVGGFLRAFKLDELPQLLNVIAGEMSVVGPRPEVPRYVALYDDWQRGVLRLRPGITDPASIRYRDEAELLATSADPEQKYISEVMPEKIRLNLDYASKATVWTDIGVIVETLFALGVRRSARTVGQKARSSLGAGPTA